MTLTFKGTDRDGVEQSGTSELRSDAVAFYRWYLGWTALDVWDETGSIVSGIRPRKPDGRRGGWWASHKIDAPGGMADPQPQSVDHQRALAAWNQARDALDRLGRPWWPSKARKAQRAAALADVDSRWAEVERTGRALTEALTETAREALTR